VCREVKRQDFAPTNYTTRCSTLSTPGVITYSCLVSSWSSSPAQCCLPATRSLTRADVYLAEEHRRRRCPRIAQFVLFVIKIPNAARVARCRKEFDRDTPRASELASQRADRQWREATSHGARETDRRRGIQHILSWTPAIIYYRPAWWQHEDICTWLRRGSRAKHLVRSSGGAIPWWDVDEATSSSVNIAVYERS